MLLERKKVKVVKLRYAKRSENEIDADKAKLREG